MTVLSKFLCAALFVIVSFNPSTSKRMGRISQLQGHPVPYKNVEEKIKETLSKQCSPRSVKPSIPEIRWEYNNGIRTISSPFSHIPRKRSSLLTEWKRHLNETAYRNGWSEHNPYINARAMKVPNIFDHFRMNGASPCRDINLVIRRKNKFGQRYNRVYRQTDVIEVVKVTKHHRIPSLNGQFALRAKMNIPKNTVLGRFCGDEMYSFEYDKVYEGTCEMKMRDDYRMGLDCPSNAFNEAELCPIQGSDDINHIVVDELTAFPGNPILFANDPRRDLSKAEMTEEDETFVNARFIDVNVNGWPHSVVINHKNIRKGDEITIHYGIQYVLPPQRTFY